MIHLALVDDCPIFTRKFHHAVTLLPRTKLHTHTTIAQARRILTHPYTYSPTRQPIRALILDNLLPDGQSTTLLRNTTWPPELNVFLISGIIPRNDTLYLLARDVRLWCKSDPLATLLHTVLSSAGHSSAFNLTRTEARILAEYACGATLSTVAQSLGMASSTARTHLARVRSRSSLDQQAVRQAALGLYG